MIRRLLDFFVFGNLLIATAALCLTMATQLLLWHSLSYHPYLFLIFFATWFVYNSHRVWAIFKSRSHEFLLPYRDQWAFQHRSFMYANTFFSLLGVIIYAFLCQLRIGFFMIPLAFVTLAYTFPFIGRKIGVSGLRAVPVLKTFLIAIVWTIVTVLIPTTFNVVNVDRNIFWLLTERFLFIFAITLPFEIRDIDLDKADDVRTIAVLLGFKKTVLLAKALIILFWIICIIHYANNIGFSIAMVISAFSTWLLIKNTRADNTEYFYLLWLDGTMILQFLLVLAASLV